jgi:hypothetical protein
MAIPESQLKTWSAPGSSMQSAATYQTIRNALNDSGSPYYPKTYSIYLQGSYGNSTNVYRDSDVDIVMCLEQTYYSDTSALTDVAKSSYDTTFSAATYGYNEFKADVLAWLTKKFGSDVRAGKKAIFIKGNANRRDADVLVCAKHRRYRKGSTGTDSLYDEGICFWSGGAQIVNFPKQHSANCMTKNQNTNEWFKPMVRVYKNMRNRMLDDGVLADGVAPSYFIEGMLWNAPDSKLGTSFADSWVNTFNWVWQADRTELVCANALYKLVFDNSHNCWPTANCNTYLVATRDYWNNWK